MIVLSLKIYLLDVVETMFFFAGGQWPGTAVWILNCSFETQEWSQTRPHKLQGFQVLFAPERPHGPMCPISCPLCPFMPPKKSGWDLKELPHITGNCDAMPTAASGHLQVHGFFPSRTQTCWFSPKSPWILGNLFKCGRFATVWQIQNVNALAQH